MTTETQTTAQNDTDAAATGESGEATVGEEQRSTADQTTTEAETSTEEQGTTESETAETQDGEEEGPQGAPEEYGEFDLPEGYTLNDQAHADFKEVAKELNLSQEAAQELINYDAKRTQAMQEQAQEQWDRTVADWQSEVKNDPEMGKGNYEASMSLANKAIDTFGGQELRAFLDESGLGNHPDLLKAFYKAGQAIGEDRMVSGDGENTGARPFYKNSNMK